MTTTDIKVMLADDHEVVRTGFRGLLEQAKGIDVVEEVNTGEDAYQGYFRCQPDVLVMDLTMPGIGGLEASRRILARDNNAHILIFTVHINEVFLSRALEQGVKGYITKQSASTVLVEAVRQVAQGEMYVSQELMPHLVKLGTGTEKHTMDKLSAREFEVFLLLAQGQSVNNVADTLNLSPKTIGHHYTSIKNKLEVSSSSELTRVAIRNGLIEA